MSSPSATEKTSTTRSTMWHSDGSVILQAQDTQFRVHWSILALNSTFFRDLQGLPQPPGQPTIDGCPVIDLAGDDVADVEYLLKALYSPPFLCQKALPLAVIAAHIRLGRKYDFREVLDLAVERLSFDNPTTLAEYDALPAPYPTRILPYDGIEFDIITLARENAIMSVLPCAYYHLLILHKTVDKLFEGVQRSNGSRASLSLNALRECVSGRDKLMHAQLDQQGSCGWYRFWAPGSDCTNSNGRCAQTRDARLRAYLDSPALRALAGFDPQHEANKQVCSACKHHISQSNADGRRKTWDRLPAFFGLPPWGELKDQP
ncbi:hypothetical protein C8F04DRAFT_1086830 [Mycena alexandri]|uniref:BTB domain-containing protein n=1 Tax=Mycena alexandri TaxID=1745969 RepID=A0AAD6T3G5_9AGAR|nr:hypothetical protein C8F04DRAFT_1086830 [Mycena alexandri]